MGLNWLPYMASMGLNLQNILMGLKKNGWARFGPKRLNEARRVGSRPWEKTWLIIGPGPGRGSWPAIGSGYAKTRPEPSPLPFLAVLTVLFFFFFQQIPTKIKDLAGMHFGLFSNLEPKDLLGKKKKQTKKKKITK